MDRDRRGHRSDLKAIARRAMIVDCDIHQENGFASYYSNYRSAIDDEWQYDLSTT